MKNILYLLRNNYIHAFRWFTDTLFIYNKKKYNRNVYSRCCIRIKSYLY